MSIGRWNPIVCRELVVASWGNHGGETNVIMVSK